MDSFTWWIEQTDIDGFRIDTLKHVEHEFWEEFCRRIRENAAALGKERFFMFGEAFDGRDDLLGSYTGPDQVDSVFYFSHKFRVFNDVFQNGAPTTAIETALQRASGQLQPTSRSRGGAGGAPSGPAGQLHRQPRHPAIPLR